MPRSLRPELREDAGTSARPARSRWLCLLAAASCLVVLGIGVRARLGLGDIDDKTGYYATSAVGWRTLPALRALRESPERLTAYCKGEARCLWRARIRLASLANFPAASTAIGLFRAQLHGTPRPCRRIAVAYERGLLLLHGVVYVVLLGFVATDRSARGSSTAWLLAMLLAATLVSRTLELSSLVGGLGFILGREDGSHAVSHYAPRNALGLVFLVQAAAFLAGRMRAWWALLVLGALLHLAQAAVLSLVFVGALLLQIVVAREGRGRLALHLAGLVALTLACLAAARSVGFDVPATAPSGAGLAGALRAPSALLLGGIFLGCLAAAVRARGRPAGWLRTTAFFAGVTGLLFALKISAASSVLPEADELLRRVSGALSPILRAPFFLLPLWLVQRRILRRRGAAPSLASASAVATLGVLAVALVARSGHVAETWAAAKQNPAIVEREICAFLRGKNVSRRGLTVLEPTDEVTFHLRIVGELEGLRRPPPSAP